MTYTASVDRYMTNNIKNNSLSEVTKYHFDDYSEAKFFVNMIKKIDRRVISAKIED